MTPAISAIKFAASLASIVAVPTSAWAASLLIWPIDPVISADSNGTALWLENRGQADAVIQVRAVRWSQDKGADTYTDQREVVVSPPMVRVAPQARQLVRLIAMEPRSRQGEMAYRVMVDEIPAGTDNQEKDDTGARLRFRMRYAIPLFVYGQDFHGKKPALVRDPGSLSCRLSDDASAIAVSNAGPVHVRLTDVRLENGSSVASLTEGLLGYVLPGKTMRWPVPPGATGGGVLKARINGSKTRTSIGACPPE